MKKMNKKAWLVVAGCFLVVAAALTLPALWMVKGQNARIGQVSYLPDYTTVILGEKAASHPVARSLYEHKQTFLIQGDQEDWTQLDQEQAALQWELLSVLMADCPTVQETMVGLGLYELTYDDVQVVDEGTLLGLDRIHMERYQGDQYFPRYWIFNFSCDPDTEKLISLNLEQEVQRESVQDGAELSAQEAMEDHTWEEEMQGALNLMVKEYLAYLDLEESSFQEVELVMPDWTQSYEQLDYCSHLIYSSEYQVYVYASLGYTIDGAYAFNLGAASLTPEELEKCLTPYN